MSLKPAAFTAICLIILIIGCASPPVQVWSSIPETQTAADPSVKITAAPIKNDHPYFVGFTLNIENPGRDAVEIDWNQTRYLHKGNDLGVFIFPGIDPGTVQGAIPTDAVPAGGTLTRDLFPLRTIAFLPRGQKAEEGRLGFMPGVLPAGENTLKLVLMVKGNPVAYPLSFRLRVETSAR